MVSGRTRRESSHAHPSKPAVSVPDCVDVGLSAVGDTVTTTFCIRNTSPRATRWLLRTVAPFEVLPSSGELSGRVGGKKSGGQRGEGTDHNESIGLSHTATVTVTFHPTVAKTVEAVAVLKIDSDDGGFETVCLRFRGRASYPHVVLGPPSTAKTGELDFGEICTGDTKTRNITLRNVSQVESHYHIAVGDNSSLGHEDVTLSDATGGGDNDHNVTMNTITPCIRLVSSPTGAVRPGETAKITVACTPSLPGEVLSEQLRVVIAQSAVTHVVRCRASAPRLKASIEPTFVAYADVACGTTSVQTVTLSNGSSVLPARYHVDTGGSAVFTCLVPVAGTVPPGGTQTLSFRFSPPLPTRYCHEVTVLLADDAPVRITLVGNAHDALHMHDALAPMPRAVLPTHVANTLHFARLGLMGHAPSCLVQMCHENGDVPAELVRVGTNIVPSRPTKAVALKTLDIRSGTPTRLPVTGSQADGETARADPGSDAVHGETGDGSEAATVPGSTASSVAPPTSPAPLCTLSTTTVGFGACPAGSRKLVAAIGTQTVTLHNHAQTAVEVVWVAPTMTDDNDENAACPFDISPVTAVVAAEGTIDFAVIFRPVSTGRAYTATLEAFVNMAEVLRDASIDDCFVTAPVRVAVRAHGHTFADGHMPPPALVWSATRVMCVQPPDASLPACGTVTVVNNGVVPACITAMVDGTGCAEDATGRVAVTATVRCTPRSCVVEAGAAQLFCLEHVATGTTDCSVPSTTVRMVIHGASSDVSTTDNSIDTESTPNALTLSHVLEVVGVAAQPTVRLDGNGHVVFPPTCIGSIATHTVGMVNTSVVALQYAWAVPGPRNCGLDLTPREGVLLPNERVAVCWTYAPTVAGTLYMRVACTIRAHKTHAADESRATRGPDTATVAHVDVSGTCHALQLEMDHPHVEFGDLPYQGASHTRTTTLYNPTPAPVAYVLQVRGDDEEAEEFAIDHRAGTLPPLGRRLVTLTAWTHRIGAAEAHVWYSAQETSTVAAPAWHPLCTLTSFTAACHLEVTNIFSTERSKRVLWAQCNVQLLNKHLAGCVVTDPTSKACEEDAEKIEDSDMSREDASGKRSPPTARPPPLARVPVDFGCGVVGSAPTQVVVQLTNTGTSPTAWALLFPDDTHYTPEPWAENAHATAHDQHVREVVRHKIFDAAPRCGDALPVGASVDVVLTYKHTRVSEGDDDGREHLAVVARVGGRADFHVVLRGQTIPRKRACLEAGTGTLHLQPQPLGVLLPPVQYFTLRNAADVALAVTVDTSALADTARRHHGFHVFELGHAGPTAVVVAPQRDLVLPVRFQPLEAMRYESTVVVRGSAVGGAEDSVEDQPPDAVLATLRLVGDAFDPRSVPLDGTEAVDPVVTVPATPYAGHRPRRVQLSTEHVAFGTVAPFSVLHRIVFVRNTHTHPVRFRLSAREFGSVVGVEPATGVLVPDEACAVRITFRPDGTPRLYHFDVVCAVDDVPLTDAHAAAVAEHARARGDADTHYMYTDAGRTGRGRAGGHGTVHTALGQTSCRGSTVAAADFAHKVLEPGFQPSYTSASLSDTMAGHRGITGRDGTSATTLTGRPSSATRLLSLAGSPTVNVTDTEMRAGRYHALPPIKVPLVRVPPPPGPPPPPQLVFCAITACVGVGMATEHPGPRAMAVVDRSMGMEAGGSAAMLVEDRGEDHVVTDLLGGMLHELIHEEDFAQALVAKYDSTTAEAPLYFRQFAPRKEAASSGNTPPTPSAAPNTGDTSTHDVHDDPAVLLLIDEVLQNTLANIMAEAHSGQFDITARPRNALA